MKTDITNSNRQRLIVFDVARVFAIFVMIAVHLEYAAYDYGTPWFATLFDYLGSPFAAPTFMFILGANIFLSSKNSPAQLFKRGITLFGISIIFNLICHALPYFCLYFINKDVSYYVNAMHWFLANDILTFSSLAFIFFALIKKYKVNNYFLIIFSVAASFINMYLVNNYQINFADNMLLASITGLFYCSSMTGYFPFLGWIVFPIVGYIYIQKLANVNNKDKFFIITGCIGLVIYLLCILFSYLWLPKLPFINFVEEYSYYQMHPFNALGTVAFCFAWISIMHFVSKLLPESWLSSITRISKNLTNIYVIQWTLINYCFVLPFNDKLLLNEWQFILCVILVFIIAIKITDRIRKN